MYRWQIVLVAVVVAAGIAYSAVTGAVKPSSGQTLSVNPPPVKTASVTSPTPGRLVLDRISAVKVGEPQHYGSLTMFPLISKSSSKLDYLTLDEAMDRGIIKVTEKDEGEVNTIVLRNLSKERVLIVDGEEVVGSKQNRIVNSSVMIAPKQMAELPVSCVEENRWVVVSKEFKSGETQLFARARQANLKAVTTNLAASPARGQQSDQSMIWDEVAQKRVALRMPSSSGPMHEAYETSEKDIDNYAKHFEVVGDQVGAIFAIDGEIVGADIFDQKETLKKLFPKIVKSYALDAIEVDAQPKDKKSSGKLNKDAAKKFLQLVVESGVKVRDYDSPGDGRDVRITSDKITGAGLVVSDTPVHVSLFAREKDVEADSKPLRR